VTDSDIREAIMPAISMLVDGVKEVLETTPPELLSDIIHRGLVITGGGALLRGIDTLIQSAIKIPIYVAEDPLTAVARGTGVILDDFDNYKDVLVHTDDISVPR
ncbi:MAG: rod shape-determining protein, partial [Candidatus Pacebacteria bacterium]|nr:rod shape-determining protein [Candidatus Paceibacterota bacterium]